MRSAASNLSVSFWTALIIVTLASTAFAQNPTPTTPASPPVTGRSSPGQASAPTSEPASSEPQPAAEAPTANDQGGMFVFKKQVEEVVLHATVLDDQRHLVPNLSQNAFAVLQDGTPQSITSFRREDVPVAMGIVVDNSGSMRDKRERSTRQS